MIKIDKLLTSQKSEFNIFHFKHNVRKGIHVQFIEKRVVLKFVLFDKTLL